MDQNFLSAYGALFFDFHKINLFLKRTRRKYFKKNVKNGEILGRSDFRIFLI